MWTPVGKISDIEEGKSIVVKVAEKHIALFKLNGEVFALDNSCPHRGGPLGEGHLEAGEVTCPWHAWSFDVKTGVCRTDTDFNQKTFPVKLKGDEILVKV